MSVLKRNNVTVRGKGTRVILLAHGFGCDQHMWKYITPAFEADYKIVLFDHVGAGKSDLSAYASDKYTKLEGYADDIIAMLEALHMEQVIFVGHSVSAMIGALASIKAPRLFASLIMVAPSPCYINDGDYIGGFSHTQIEELLEALDSNHLGWSVSMAPVIMGNADRPELGEELANSFCQTDPAIAREFARTTFLTDKRNILSSITTPTLILQCSSDVIAPVAVGEYMQQHIPGSQLVVMNATGHCPNLSAPAETIAAIKEFLS
ncbi:MAG: alpha/beta hydrolase [Rhizobacter sp.]|nr:alpha/beta hydrolase [Ferruginibacter sp.]